MKKSRFLAIAVAVLPAFAAQAQSVVVGGDVRVRNEWGEGDTVLGLLRARVSLEAQLDYDWDVGIRLATGGGLTSHNQSMDALNETADAYWDRLFIRHRVGGDNFAFLAGRMPNQFVSTMITWDSEFSPDGLAQVARGDNGLFLVAGVHPLSLEAGNKYQTVLYGIQPGFEIDINGDKLAASVAYYDFQRADSATATPTEVPADSDYVLLDALVSWKTRLFRQPFSVFVQSVTNTSADDDNQAVAAGVVFGRTSGRGTYDIALTVASIGADAFWLPLGDSTLHDGFDTLNMRAAVVSFGYGLSESVRLGANWYSKRETGGAGATEEIIQLEIAASF